jgi:hypothetical protein
MGDAVAERHGTGLNALSAGPRALAWRRTVQVPPRPHCGTSARESSLERVSQPNRKFPVVSPDEAAGRLVGASELADGYVLMPTR